jgi:hypothetical protein
VIDHVGEPVTQRRREFGLRRRHAGLKLRPLGLDHAGVYQVESVSYRDLDASPLGFVFAMFADSAGTATYGYCDWIRIAQLAP